MDTIEVTPPVNPAAYAAGEVDVAPPTIKLSFVSRFGDTEKANITKGGEERLNQKFEISFTARFTIYSSLCACTVCNSTLCAIYCSHFAVSMVTECTAANLRGKFLSMDWQNDEQQPYHVIVTPKDMVRR